MLSFLDTLMTQGSEKNDFFFTSEGGNSFGEYY